MFRTIQLAPGASIGPIGRTLLLVLAALAALAVAVPAAHAQSTCRITGSLQTCSGGTTTLCGPAAYTFTWSNGDTARCITVGAGTYSLIVSSIGVPAETCSVTVVGGLETTTDLEVTKTAESVVDNGALIHYLLQVRNTSTSTDMESVRVVDTLCDSVRWMRAFSVPPTSQPELDSLGGTVEWTIASLDAGETVAIQYEVRAARPDTTCNAPADILCENDVAIFVNCAVGGGLPAAADTVTTAIRCVEGGNGGGGGGGDEVGSCPRGPDFWRKQCAWGHGQGRGHAYGTWKQGRLSDEQMEDILERIGDRLVQIEWDGDEDAFCRLVKSASDDDDARGRAHGQYAIFMANWAAGDLEIEARNGDKVALDPEGSIDCDAFEAETIGELIDEADFVLAELEDSDASSAEKNARYEEIADCLGAINEGDGIRLAEGCGGRHDDDDDDGDDEDEDSRAAEGSAVSAASPNPFGQQTGFRYEVAGAAGSDVSITIYNVAGRLVRTLVAAHRESGEHAVTWDGRTDDGLRAARGVYFVRAIIDGRQQPTQRLLFLRD